MDKNTLTIAIGFIALIFLIWNFTISVQILNYLKNNGENINPATMHFKIFDHARKYKELTIKESGNPGNLYQPFMISFAIFALILFSGILLVAV